ncbi:hypothetical protein GRI38_07155 [Altererythrobacter aurantiacus]|uniref:Tetratricopeptide repeat-containing protein n=1 Tax=Parapontixanthobacter aurantiacus TaxID=1463599 RepID=A0A844ZDG7_9SPHN|nr:hypothetical protein [Parapontixanthobacter aurantiacus]MXO85808.1 hypothetical protein [Parapontixanthobacter aurantiacus]
MKRAASIAAILVYAVAVLASGADRIGLSNPLLQAVTPFAFRSEGLGRDAASAMQTGDHDAAVASATAAVRSAPNDAEGVARLAYVLDLVGQRDASVGLLQSGARLGWREPLTQFALFAMDMGEGNFARAARHADALLRIDERGTPAQTALVALEARSEGRIALRDRLRRDPLWAERFYAPDEKDALLRRATYLGSSGRDAQGWGCARTRPLVQAALEREWRREAQAVYRRQCKTEGPNRIADANFDAVAQNDPGLFGWTVQPSGDVSISSVRDGTRTKLAITNRSSAARMVLSQPVALGPGRHRITVAGGVRSTFAATLSCGAQTATRPAFSKNANIVEALPCRSQTLSIWVRGNAEEAILETVAIEPAL